MSRLKRNRSPQRADFLVFPYRDAYFYHRYGPCVRDLALLKALACDPRCNSVLVVNRPVSLFERATSKRTPLMLPLPKTETVDFTWGRMVLPGRQRAWVRDCYRPFTEAIRSRLPSTRQLPLVVLDFSPVGDIDYSAFDPDFVWYDVIDNFRKHNRFSEGDRRLVSEKYERVGASATLITGVTAAALEGFPAVRTMVIPNGVGSAILSSHSPSRPPEYDLGYLGFITDKFDLEFVSAATQLGPFTAAVYGEIYDRSVGRRLRQIRGVRIFGAFHSKHTAELIRTFCIGLVPYRLDRLHDESPLKAYDYLFHGRPVLSTIPIEVSSPFVIVSDAASLVRVSEVLRGLVSSLRELPNEMERLVRSSIRGDHTWEARIRMALDRLLA